MHVAGVISYSLTASSKTPAATSYNLQAAAVPSPDPRESVAFLPTRYIRRTIFPTVDLATLFIATLAIYYAFIAYRDLAPAKGLVMMKILLAKTCAKQRRC
jgi:hypothetical protein